MDLPGVSTNNKIGIILKTTHELVLLTMVDCFLNNHAKLVGGNGFTITQILFQIDPRINLKTCYEEMCCLRNSG